MAENTAAAAAPGADDAAQRASEQARQRKARREAKIKAGGSARLSKITGIGGRVVGDTEQATPAAQQPAAPAPPVADPEEGDISEHVRAQAPTPRGGAAAPAAAGDAALSEARLRQMMLGLDRGAHGAGPGPQPPGAAEEDQLMKMVSQMMAGFAPGGSSPSPFPGMPFPQQPQQQQQQASARPGGYALLFRLLHALLALGLGLYVVAFASFAGTRAERERAALAGADEQQGAAADVDAAGGQRRLVFLWIFATGEAVLLTSRFFLDKAAQPPPGMLWTVVGFLPEPLRGYLTVGLRYGQIFMTVRADLLACVFVLGVCCWWQS